MNKYTTSCLLVNLAFFASVCYAATINLTVKFSEASLNKKWFPKSKNVFGLHWSTCLQTPGNVVTLGGTATCPEGHASFDSKWFIQTTDKVANQKDTWLKVIQVPETYTGKVTIELWAPTDYEIPSFSLNSSVTPCLSLAEAEMSGEFCGQHGSPWTVNITDPKQQIVYLTAFPAFGIGPLASIGVSKVLLPNFYSPQLDNSRDIPAYIPPSLLQNNVSRPINVMIILDATLSVIESYSKNTGFESGQLMGVVPETIMIGISCTGFVYQGTREKLFREKVETVKDLF